jgi:hypothetical protein
METAHARPRRRPRRGSVDRPIDTRLVRNVALVLAAPLALLVLTLARSGPLPPPALPPTFDAETALELTRELTRDHPSRVPGSLDAQGAAEWFVEQVGLTGLPVEADVWREEVPGLGEVELRNLAVVVRGTLDETITVVAHRDNREGTTGANDNATGTAALLELARAFATVGTGGAQPRRPLHTLVLLSTDAGAYGDVGAQRFARSARGRATVAAIVLHGLGGRVRPHVEVAGLDRASPGVPLVRTLLARLDDEGALPVRPGVLEQLVALGIPLGLGEQAPLLGAGVPAVLLGSAPTTADGTPDEPEALDPARLARLGSAVDATLGSLDAAVLPSSGTEAKVFLASRAIRGWALELLLLTALLPFAAATLDLVAWCRRRGTRLRGAWRAYRRRLGFWLLGLVALGVLGLAGALPLDTELPPRPDLPPVESWPIAGVGALVLLGALAWQRERSLLAPRGTTEPEEELAGWAVAMLALLVVAALVAVASPFALVFLLPSLYAWLALVQVGRGRPWLADVLFGIGLVGPVVPIVVLSLQLDLGLRGPLYAAALMTSGTVPWLVTLAIAGWVAVAAQAGALVAGRYAPVASASSRR